MTRAPDRLRRKAAEVREETAIQAAFEEWLAQNTVPDDRSREALVHEAIFGKESDDPKARAIAHLTGG